MVGRLPFRTIGTGKSANHRRIQPVILVTVVIQGASLGGLLAILRPIDTDSPPAVDLAEAEAAIAPPLGSEAPSLMGADFVRPSRINAVRQAPTCVAPSSATNIPQPLCR